MIDYDSFSRCHLKDIFFRFSRGSKRVKKRFGLKFTHFYFNIALKKAVLAISFS